MIPARFSGSEPAAQNRMQALETEIAALRRQERRYRDLFDRMTCALAIYEAVGEGRDFVFRDFNQAAERVEKVHRDEVVGRSVSDVLPGARDSGLLEAFRRVWQTGHTESHSFALRRDGRVVGRRESTVYKLPSGEVVTVFADVNERERMEDALRESEERYRLLASLSLEGIAIHENGQILDLNQRLANMFGATGDELLGRDLAEFAADDARLPAIKDLVLGLLDTCEVSFRRKDGTTFTAQVTTKDTVHRGHRRRFVAVRDVTDRKIAQEERLRLATAVEQAAEMIVVTRADGTVEYVNPAFERAMGYSRDEIVGRKPGEVADNAKDRGRERELWSRISGEEVWSGRFAHRRKDGSHIDAAITVSPVRDGSGRIVNYVAVMRDVSEVTRLESQLRQAQKMEAIGTLAGGIAHDFNNTLYAILGFTELAMSKIPKENKAFGCLEHVRRAGTRASELVNQILTFSRQKEQVRESLRFQDVVEDALALLRRTIPSTIEIRSRIAADCRPVHGDRTQLDQVIVNLCTNAYQAMREQGGLLEVELAEATIPRAAVGETVSPEPGAYVRLVVRDNGPGMERAIRERVFEPYFTTKPVREGTGMGLAIVHGIVSAMGGAIRVESAPGRGATFEVLLPVVGERSAGESEGIGERDDLAGRERVLFVDDEEAIIQLGRMSLEAFGYRVTTFTDSVAAFAAFREDPASFDVVVTDETMPQMTGHELARRLLRLRPGLPIILCTGFSETINEERAKQEGIREYVLKPVTMDTLARAIRRACDAARAAKE
jgi:PAS domain S-box-containing protein